MQPEQLDCGAAHLQHPLALRRPLRATPLFEYTGLSSVAVDDIHNHTVVFLGTSNGRLRKVRRTNTRRLTQCTHNHTHMSRQRLNNTWYYSKTMHNLQSKHSYSTYWLSLNGITIFSVIEPLSKEKLQLCQSLCCSDVAAESLSKPNQGGLKK